MGGKRSREIMSAQNSSEIVTIFGGSGFVGRYIVRALAQKGYRIRVAVRRPETAGFLQPLGGVGQINPIQANVRNAASVSRAVQGSSAIINLVGLLYSRGKQSFDAVHVEGARNIAEAAKFEGIDKFIHMSSIGANPGSKSSYARTKAKGEGVVQSEIDKAVILRASVIFGPEDDFYNRFAGLAQIAPVLPLIGGGKTRLQPVYVGDVARAVVVAMEGGAQQGSIYELGGPQIITLKEVMQQVLQFTDRKRALIGVPFFFAKMKALFLQLLPTPPLTVDQVRLLQQDNVVSENAIAEHRTFEGLGIQSLQTTGNVVPEYLERFRTKGQFSNYTVQS